MAKAIPRIAITGGEPAGIGPELVVQLAQQAQGAELVVVADAHLLQQRAQLLNLPLTLKSYDPASESEASTPSCLKVMHMPLAKISRCGQADPDNAQYVINTLTRAGNGCLNGEFAAVVTAPVHKAIINQAGIAFSGHTEFFAALTHTPQVVMMLATRKLRVALVTTHLPLAAVASTITAPLLEKVLLTIHQDLQKYFGIVQPQIFVCGLNPHAGENGYLGREEIAIIEPTLQALRDKGLTLHGPLSADTLFTQKYLDKADVVVAMYHDQGLPVLKHIGFGQAVNITLGLPIIRTSVDHGTAFDLAGTGKACVQSLQLAVQTAIEMSNHYHA